MIAHTCVFSIMRFQAQYRGNLYELDECESCGFLRLTSGPEQERRLSPGSAEFDDVIAFFEFLIRRARNLRKPRIALAPTQD